MKRDDVSEDRRLNPAIEAIGLTKRFPKAKSYRDALLRPFARQETIALQDVFLTVNPGEIFALVGPNGAGKTTLIKILSTLILPTDGGAFIAGFDVKRDANQVKKRIGCVVTEERSFYWRLTGRQNLGFFAVLNNLSKADAHSRVSQVIALVDMERDADKMFKDYSTGMRHRLAISRALLTDPEIVLFDEPTRSLDPPSAEAIRRWMKAFVRREPIRTVLFATHDLAEAETLAGRIAILDRGRIRACGTPGELKETVRGKKQYNLKLRQPKERVIERLTQLAPSCRSTGDGAPEYAAYVVEVRDPAEVSSIVRELVLAGAAVVECAAVTPSLHEVFDAVTSYSV
ncbi:MAG: ABC transporter ATP-binding protein [bacterium]|nr:ABC transporter ATP-binding protein [bacterium]